MMGAGAPVENQHRPYALLVPTSGLGHVNAVMLLARSLAAQGFKAEAGRQERPSSRSTGTGRSPRIHSGEEDASSRNCFIDIHVVEDGFDPRDIYKMHFLALTPAMKENLYNLILELREQGSPPTCLISDTFEPWTAHVAERAGIPRIDFSTSNAMSYVHAINLPTLISEGIFPEKGSPTKWIRETPLMLHDVSGLPPFPSEHYPPNIRFVDATSSPIISVFSQVSSCAKHTERILIHTMSELESDAFRAFQVSGIGAYAIGPLIQYAARPEEGFSGSSASQAKEKSEVLPILDEQADCISWLDMQADLSVIYIAFGSFASLTVRETQELAFGLEGSDTPFLWVVRTDPQGGKESPQVLPSGFLERTRAKGMIIGWAPQVEVLAHKAVGGFLSHCGWNSTLESICEGVPMLCCPRVAEQRLNSHYICDVWGMGLELGRTETGGLERRDVEVGVKGLMQEARGVKARDKAHDLMELAKKTCKRGGHSYGNLQKFYDDMKILCSKPP